MIGIDQIHCGDCLEKGLLSIKTISAVMAGKKGVKKSEEHRRKISMALKKAHAEGRANSFEKGNKYCRSFLGKKHTDEWKAERSEAMKIDNPMKSPETAAKVSLTRITEGTASGEKNPHWKGGSPSYRGPSYDRQRMKVLERDSFTCTLCGVRQDNEERQLDVHHIIPYKNGGTNDLSNLITVCRSCHNKIEPMGGSKDDSP